MSSDTPEEGAGPLGPPDDEAPTQDVPIRRHPRCLGPCHVIGPLGAGGTASVFLAEMAEDRSYAAAGQRVAIKVLDRERLGGVDAALRFMREAELGRSIDHPGVARTFEIGTEQHGPFTVHFLVLELVEGRSLAEMVRDFHTVPEALLRDLAAQVARALAAIHEKGIVHRDIKPSNILLTTSHQVKLVDLGVARRVAGGDDLTKTGIFVGTPLYASPEQLTGKPVGAASDLYSLGVTLYEAATGSQPFRAGEMHATMRRHLSDSPPRAGSVNPHLTPFVEEVLACLLEKEASHRFASAAELAQVLEAGEDSAWWRAREGAARAAVPSRELRLIRVPRDTRVIGRDEELEMLLGLAREAREGRGRTVLLQGEAGVGKTRLLDELVARLGETGDGVHLLYGSYPPADVGRVASALSEAVVGHFGEADLEKNLAAYLTAAPRLAAPFAAYLMGSPPPKGSEALSRDAVHAVFCHLARGLAAERPVVWIVDDLHFADADGRAVFLSLARSVLGHRLLLIGTFRHALPAQETSHLERLESTRKLSLDRLSAREVIVLLREALRSDSLAEQLGGRIAVKSDGNPYFIFEMIRELKERDALKELPDGSYAAPDFSEPISVPSTVRKLLLSHIHDAPVEQRTLLDMGAVLGYSFDPDLLARARNQKRLHVLESLAGIERQYGVIRATGMGFEFDHHQFQEALYGALPPVLRNEYHALLAEAYAKREGWMNRPTDDIPGEAAHFLAEHYLRASRREGLAFALRAFEHLAALNQNEAVVELAEMGVNLLRPEDAALRCDVRLHQVECLSLLAHRDRQRAAAEDALAAAQACGDSVRKARASIALAVALYSTSQFTQARTHLERAVDQACGDGDQRTQARALDELARLSILQGHLDESVQAARECLAVSVEIGEPRIQADAELSLGTALLGAGDHREAMPHLRRSRELASEARYRRREAAAACALGVAAMYQGDFEEARENLERYPEICREIGQVQGTAVGLVELGVLATEEGRLEVAEECLRRALPQAQEIDHPLLEAWTLMYLGDLGRARNRQTESRTFYERALTLGRHQGAANVVALTLVRLGRHCLETGEPDQARSHLEEAETMARQFGLASVGPLPAAYLALLGAREASTVSVTDQTEASVRAQAHWTLYRAGGDQSHLSQAHDLLERMSRHLVGAEAEAFWRNNPTARAVALASHD